MDTPDTSHRVKAPEVTPPTPPEAAREAEVRAMAMGPGRTSMARTTPEVLTPTLGTTEATKASTPGQRTEGPLQLEGSVKDTQVIHLFVSR